MIETLNEFKSFKITKSQLQSKIGENLYRVKIEQPIIVNHTDVIYILERYKSNEISVRDLVDWVNVVWFTDLFDYAERYQDSIASVMTELEELDEEGQELTSEKIDMYIDALQNNREV